MKIAVIGATGMAGSRVVNEALRRGCHVTAYARNARSAEPCSQQVRALDAGSAESMERVARDHDVLVLATRPRPGVEVDAARVAEVVLDAALTWGSRVVVIGGAGPLRVGRGNRRAIEDPRYVLPEWRQIAQASVDQYNVFREHRAECVYVSPSAQFEPGERTGYYVRGGDHILTSVDGDSYVSAEDFAVAVLDEIEQPDAGFRHFTVASPRSRVIVSPQD